MNWRTPPLGSLVEAIVPARDKPKELEGPVPWVRIEDFDGKYISGSKSGQGVSRETIRSMPLRVFPEGTVVCTCSCNMGTTAIVTKPLVTNQTFIGLRPTSNDLSAEFLYYSLQAHRDELNAQATGAIQSYLSREDFTSLRLPIPPFPEQRAIADYLDRETVRIDALIAAKLSLLELLATRRSAWLSERLREITAGLPLTKLKYVARIQGGVTLGKSYPESQTISWPYLRVANVQATRVDLSDVATIDLPPTVAFRFLLRKGDLLLAEGNGNPNNLGRAVLWKAQIRNCLHQNHVFALRAAPVLKPEYLEAVLAMDSSRRHFREGASQVGIASISQEKVLSLRLPVPETRRQDAFVAELIEYDKRDERLIESLTTQVELIREHRRSLITEAVTGRAEVPVAA